MKQTDWEQFLLNIIAHNLVLQMRLLKKAKEKRNKLKAASTATTNALDKEQLNQTAINESNLIDMFFDLEAELEKGICRDQVSFDSGDTEQGLSNKQSF